MDYIDSFPDRKITINGSKKLYFGGTAYLGLQTNTAFQKIYIKNIKKYGTNYGASRKSNIKLSVYDKAEKHLAKLVQSEACVTQSSGYLAGQLICDFLKSKGHSLFYAPHTHVALHQYNSKNYNSYNELEKALENHLKKSKKTPVVLLDSLDFNSVNYPSFTALKKLPLDKIIIVADDSHAIGLPLNNGRGCFSLLKKLNPKELIVCTSLGKGFAVQGGAIFGNKKRIEELKNTDFYGGASPASPASLATLIDAETIYKKKQKRLQKHITTFIKEVKNIEQFSYTPDHAAFNFTNQLITKHLEKNNIIITNFNYPNEDSAAMSRIVLSAHHKKEDIKLVCNLINTLF